MYIYVSPKLESKPSRIAGGGLFAREPILRDEVLFDTSKVGENYIISKNEADSRFEKGFDYMLQIGENQFLVTVDEKSPSHYGFINSSYDPNCGIRESRKIVAMRDIITGEEITFDYAMSESSNFKMTCFCKSYNCRKQISGNDWKIKDLQVRYRGFFSEYLQKKINKL
jgi:SET domain-containing protein